MTNNILKIIAIITMIIDHFGYYFYDCIPQEVYYICRAVGRIAMPIFTYLVIEGYFNTSNLKKYILRLILFAVVTQISFFILDFVAQEKSYNLVYTANILFSFVVLLSLMKLFENAIEKKSFKNKLLFVIMICIVIFMYQAIKFDYGISLLLLGISMYLCKKYISNISMYKFAIAITTIIITIISATRYIQLFSILAVIPIILYNGKLGKKSKLLKTLFYLIFPLQHISMYLLSIIL